MNKQAIEHLDATLELLRSAGWTQGTEKDHRGCLCLTRALADSGRVLGIDWFNSEGIRAIRRVIAERTGQPYSGVIVHHWNDYVATEESEVYGLIEEAKGACS